MKKRVLVLTSALFLLTFSIKAQKSAATMGNVSFGVRAGINFNNVVGEFEGDDFTYSLKAGFNAGVTVDIPVAPEFYVQTGLLYATKGATVDAEGIDKVNVGYLELPISFLYKPMLGTGKLLLGVGPYVAYGLHGKVSGKDGEEDRDVKFANEADVMDSDIAGTVRRFDAGANLLAGYELSNNLSIQLNAQMGLVKVNPKYTGFFADADVKAKNIGFGLSLGYKF